MKILFFTYDFPFPTNTGGKNRAFHLLKYAKKKHDITLFSFVRDDFNAHSRKALEDIGVSEIYTFKRKKVFSIPTLLKLPNITQSIFRNLYYDSQVHDKLINVLKSKQINIFHAESFYTSFYISRQISELGVKQVFGTENVEYKLYEDYAKYIAPSYLKQFYNFQSMLIKKEEKKAVELSDCVLAVTDEEEKYFNSLSSKKTKVIANGVDIKNFPFYPKKISNKKTILFVGNFSYFPNIDAMNYFYEKIFLRLKRDDVIFTIVGKKVNDLKNITDSRVQKIEFIEDIKSLYYGADVLVSPVRIGGGTNFKILEAMAAGVPVISHPNLLSGLHASSGKELLIAKTSDEFIDEINNILDNTKIRNLITKNARKCIEENYSWEVIGNLMHEVWSTL